jgi:hypothetical protein
VAGRIRACQCLGTTSARRKGNAAYRHPQAARLPSAALGMSQTACLYLERWMNGFQPGRVA